MSEPNRVFINILGKDYQIACPSEERDALSHAAEELDKRMRTTRNTGNIIGLERIAVMTALNLCHELHKIKNNGTPSLTANEEIERVISKLDKALS